jgi:serine/threonine protein kinase
MAVATQEFVAGVISSARSHKRFKPIDVLGQGTYGKVYKAVDLDDLTRAPVAMKKVKRDARRGYSVTVMREIALLQRLRHENVVELFEGTSLFRHCAHTLSELVELLLDSVFSRSVSLLV